MSQKITKFFAPTEKHKVAVDLERMNKEVRNFSIVVKDIKDDIQKGTYKGLEIVNDVTRLMPIGEKPKNMKNFIKRTSRSDENGLETSSFECLICYKTFSSELCVYRHIQKQHHGSLHSCSICDKKFTKKGHLTNHMSVKHPGGKIEKFECDFCGKVLNTKGSIYNHMSAHLPAVKCRICGVEFRQNYIKNHLRDFHATKKKFNCDICPASFKSKQLLSQHAKSHQKRFECEICNKKFRLQCNLKNHQREVHENPGSFSCDKCGKKFNTKRNLKSHRKVHDRFRKKPFKCEKCSFSTDLKANYEVHQKRHQRQEEKFAAMKNPLKCEKCGKFSRDKQTLNIHMKQVHPLEKLQCDLCGKYIKTMTNLKQHFTKLHLAKISKDIKD